MVAELQEHAEAWRYTDAARLMDSMAGRLDEEKSALRARWPSPQQAPASRRALQSTALRALEEAHAALSRAGLAWLRVAESMGIDAPPEPESSREEEDE